MLHVWVSDWQMGRTGTPFSVGSRVRWTVSTEIDREWLALAIGQDSADKVDYIEAADDGPVTITGTVSAIEAIQCRFEPHPTEPGTWPVNGSEHITCVAYAAHWMPD